MAKGLDAGNAYVTVKVDTSGFTRDLNSNVRKSMRDTERSTGKSMAGIAGVAGQMTKVGALAVGAVAVGAIAQIGKMGIEYQNSLNIFQAATSATAAQMDRVKTAARALGNDITLPGVSAKDAALAMTELAKGGLNVEQSMRAAKGTMQLATAAQLDGAAAAEIQANALAMFGLKAEQAGHVADVLANVSNAASGEITDFALALKYVGPIAKASSISIDQTATAMGVLANAGIKGETAGTTLREMLRSLSAPSKAGARALKTLGVDAYDSSGKFVGFGKVIGQLTGAQKKMTQEGFQKATSDAFGASMAGVVAMAQQGPAAFTAMEKAVSKSGGAAQLAAAKSKGLGGAWDSLMSTVETAGLQIYDKFAPGIEEALRGFGEVLPGVIDDLGDFANKALSAFEDIGKSPFMARLGEAVTKNTPLVKEGLAKTAEGAKGFADGFTEQFSKIVDSKTMTDMVDSIQRIVDVIDGPLGKAWDGILKPALEWLGKALGFIVGSSLKQFEFALNTVADAFEFLSRNMGTVNEILTITPRFMQWVWDAGKALVNWITGTMWPGIKNVWKGFTGALAAVGTFVSSSVRSIIGFFVGLGRGVATAVRLLWTYVTTLFRSMWVTVTTAVRTGVTTVVESFTGLKTRVVGALSTAGTWLYNAGRNIIDGIVRGIRGVLSWVTTAVGGIKAKVTGAISGASTWLLQVGKDVISGMTAGIEQAKHWIVEKLGALANLLPQWAKKALGIASPAKIMLEPGRMIGAGLAAGIDASGALVEKAVDRLAATAHNAITAGPVTVPVVAAADLRTAHRAATTAGRANAVGRVGPAGAAPAVHITVNGALDPNAVGKQVVDLLRREGRFRAGPVLAG